MAAEVVSYSSTERPMELHSCRYVYRTIEKDVSALETFKRFLKAVNSQDSQVLKPQLLKKLYLFFVYLSELSRDCSISRDSDYVGITIQKFNYTVKISDIFDISDFLFDELSRRFNVCIIDKEIALPSLHSEYWGTQEDLIVLLRCCMAVLQLLQVEPSTLLEKYRVLLVILRRICSSDSSYEHSDSDVPFVSAILEVFVDELLMHRQLRQYFIQFDHLSFTNDKLFKDNCGVSDIDAVLEVISAHFLLSVRDECWQKKVVDTSILRNSIKLPCSELSLTAAMQLLGSSGMVSAPHIFQAYLISLVSKCIGIDMASDGRGVDEILKNYYISAFEKAFNMYARHIFCLELCSHHQSATCSSSSDKSFSSGRRDSQSFESYIRPFTYNGIIEVANLADSCPSLAFKAKSEFLTASNAYMKENEQILNKFYKDEILSALDSVVSWSLVAIDEGIELHTFRDVSQQETHLLASVMNLMSHSLLQVIRCLHGGSLSSQKSMKNDSFCKEYDVIVGIIGCLRLQSYCHSSQKLLNELMESNSTSHKESKLMVMHLADILLFCYNQGHEYLWRSCISMMMTLMNLIMFEDGNFEALQTLLSCKKKSLCSCSVTKPTQVLDTHNCTVRIAKKFQKIQKLHLRNRDALESADGGATCSGRKFLKLRNVKQSDFDDLVDFVGCTRGKNYSEWFKNKKKLKSVLGKRAMAARKRRREMKRNFLHGIQTRKLGNPRYSVYR